WMCRISWWPIQTFTALIYSAWASLVMFSANLIRCRHEDFAPLICCRDDRVGGFDQQGMAMAASWQADRRRPVLSGTAGRRRLPVQYRAVARLVSFWLKTRNPKAQRQRRRAFTTVRFGSKQDMCSAKRHVRFTPEADVRKRKGNVH